MTPDYGLGMNALNILSARIIGARSPKNSSTATSDELPKVKSWSSTTQKRRSSRADLHYKDAMGGSTLQGSARQRGDARVDTEEPEAEVDVLSTTSGEKSSIPHQESQLEVPNRTSWRLMPKRIADALVASLRWLLSTLAIPGVYLVTCFYDDQGKFSPLLPARKLGRFMVPRRGGTRSTAQAVGISATYGYDGATSSPEVKKPARPQRMKSTASSWRPGFWDSPAEAYALVKDEAPSDIPSSGTVLDDEPIAERTRSKTSPSTSSDESISGRKTIRTKAQNVEAQKRRRSRKTDSMGSRESETSTSNLPLTPATIKSPTSPSSSLRKTKYPQTPVPPRPLIPRHPPSYTNPNSLKTLILDLDETLIHSLAKGGRMSTGHMVEVKLNAPVGLGGGATLAPQHPILYYVHKRPHCDDFLRKVCKWYNLVIFTASVQEYADPVIDWLEQDRKYFSGRYYRQHCTLRGGNYIKDIRCVEPDLSKVMIVDNSPASYIFHEDNAIPIEGWINDPTDNDLLHLIPLLEGLQYATDVRALLTLRMGELSTLLGSSPSSKLKAL
ncbi:MAG: Nuclear envelope morphology protein 1 [Peltula sp. TS41687]|nr:MAG: Nuclear envelope morphology protein 1 [Peltula sp. TS41687]